MNDIHSSSCKAEETATLTAKHGYKLEDNTDNLDAYEMLPKERWLLGHSNGKRNNMIFIKKSSAETSYYRFHCPSKVPINSKSIPFRCDKNYCGCHSCAYICIDQEQIVTASVMHKPNCGHRCWNAMIEEQKDYKAQLAAAGVDGQNKAYSEIPCVKKKRVKSLLTSSLHTDNNSSPAAVVDTLFSDSINVVHHMATRSNQRRAQKSHVSIQQKITAAVVEVEETLVNDCSDSDNTIIVCISSDSEDSDKENQDFAVCEMRSSVIRNPTSNELNRHKIFPIFNRVKEQTREIVPEKSKRLFTSTSDKLVTKDPCISLKKPKLEVEQQPNHINCSVDLDDFKDVKLSYNSLQFVRPSNVWLIECCKLLDVNSSNSAYKNWAMLRDVDLASTEFPQMEHVKTFKEGFELVSYLLTGSEEGASAVKEQIGMYFLDHHETMGGVEGLDCSKMTRKDVGSVIFAADMSPIHFKVVSKLFKCTVVIYNYLKKSKFVVKCEDSGAPTIVAGFNEEGYFVFLD